MTHDNIQSELDRDPFIPFRLHLVSGNNVDIPHSAAAFMLQQAVLILHDPSDDDCRI
jgi:hypothetical protein